MFLCIHTDNRIDVRYTSFYIYCAYMDYAWSFLQLKKLMEENPIIYTFKINDRNSCNNNDKATAKHFL